MNENVDLTKILDGCPVGTMFYSSIYGDVQFVCLNPGSVYPITMRTSKNVIIYLTRDGRADHNYDGECTLFPSKDQRDWSKFKRFWDKPKVKKFDVNTLQPFDKVLVRDYPKEYWRVDIFGFMIDEITCCTTAWRCCIPYNEETKHLVGTKNDCPEYYKWWEE